MTRIAFIDSEINPERGTILDLGGVKDDGSRFHRASAEDFTRFLEGIQFVAGHNILWHDMTYIGDAVRSAGIPREHVIDTLHLSPLLFPTKPYHALLKDDKLQSDELNNPLNDAIKAKELFDDEVTAFRAMDQTLRRLLYLLLREAEEFRAFFVFQAYEDGGAEDVESLIRQYFEGSVCEHAKLSNLILKYPVELAYALSLIDSYSKHQGIDSITPPWVLKNYPKVEQIMTSLRSTPCLYGCAYCDEALDAHKGLKRFFGFDAFRTYEGEPLQEQAVEAAIRNHSILAVFPTGGGKSLTFQLPALMNGENQQGLTVVISPLQSLMKDQVDNLESQGITRAVTVNGLLDPIERAKSFERVEDGSAAILYISPESLRSRTIERLIMGRKVVRFVIDEAHCFSAWGQDFRVDYLYIGDFIKKIQEQKNLDGSIPVSCFTATAKQKVIEDIRSYFKEKLALELEVFQSGASRSNLHYKVFEETNEEDKYQTLRRLIEAKPCPTIVYVSRTRRAYELAQRLTKDGLTAAPYHGKMKATEKVANQNAFIAGEISIMVATSAFGMGVDKKDVGMVIHYDISDSLENYVQEAGRAGRDERIEADCFVLFNEEDLSKHFILLNQTKLSIKEIQQIWRAIKHITHIRTTVSNSALEIARKAGWDENVMDIETRVKAAIAALEDAGYVKRGRNMPRVFANSIQVETAQEAVDRINASTLFVNDKQREQATRIIKALVGSRSRKALDENEAEARVDYLSDHLGIVKDEVINIIYLLREEKILADAMDLTAFIKRRENKNRSLRVVQSYGRVANYLLSRLGNEEQQVYSLKELNEDAGKNGCDDVSVNIIKTILNFWEIKHWIRRKNMAYSKNHVAIRNLYPKQELTEKMEACYRLVPFIAEYLYEKSNRTATNNEDNVVKEEIAVEFSVNELKEALGRSMWSFGTTAEIADIKDALFYLSRIDAIKMEGGFLVTYNGLTIERLEQDNRIQYKMEDYQKLNLFYENKVAQIHIVGEYAKKMIDDYEGALTFVNDYFQLNYGSFLSKYFKGSRQEDIKRNITPAKFRQLFGDLSPSQLGIIKDNTSKYIVVAAGPGSGKTRVLAHKLASLLLMEDVKHEQLLMLTFARAAATEFKKRLLKLIGNAANFIEIKTFHSYCFDLLGRVGSVERSDSILKDAVEKIRNGEVEASRVTKAVLVIDEAQDMNEDEFGLIAALMERNEEMRLIAVGDDDQSIFEFRGASPQYMERLMREYHAKKYELLENYRSKDNLVRLSDQFVRGITHRLKEMPVVAKQRDNGQIRILRQRGDQLVVPLVQALLKTELRGTTCVLTKTNEAALLIVGLLLKDGMPAKLVQTNDAFSLRNLAETRFFWNQIDTDSETHTISDQVWDAAKRAMDKSFSQSDKLELCHNMLYDFEVTNPKRKYKSDLDAFFRESKLEDFIREESETIFVSTIHKAKGKEYDNIFLLLESFNPTKDEEKRLLYVAMTRAKRNLTVVLRNDCLDRLSVGNMERQEDETLYPSPNEIAIQLTHEDVNLGYFGRIQTLVEPLVSGDALSVNGDNYLNANGQPVLKFSQKFVERIAEWRSKGYMLRSAQVNFVVHWWWNDYQRELKIILPELRFAKG
ncbi:MAG: RecQ family ATP-dependent DNA helicase [Mediterranea sp.]|jgi:ATP-dependent DNA helicase RecQ|nr:RecQ family ATP-dependent DNA helicase [Mediterranea sp.]